MVVSTGILVATLDTLQLIGQQTLEGVVKGAVGQAGEGAVDPGHGLLILYKPNIRILEIKKRVMHG